MEKTQVKKLKITATKIKNSLFGYNKELIKLKKDKINLQKSEEEKKKISKKEASLEFLPLKTIQNIGKTLLNGPLTLIDKLKEFFGFILLGILVNNLPTIIQKLQDIFGKIKDFFDKNPWIMDTVKWFGSVFAQSIMSLAKFVKFITPYVGGSFKFALDAIKSTKNEIGILIQTFDELDLSFGGLIRDLNIDKIPDVNEDPSRYSQFVAGGGKKALEQKGQTVNEVVEQGKKNIQRYSPTPEQPKPQTQKFAKGGTVKQEKKSTPIISKPISKTPFARPGGTAKGRKAIKEVKSFNVFRQNVKDQSLDLQSQDKNFNMFEQLLKKFKELRSLKEKEKGGDGGGDGGGLEPGEISVEGGSKDFWLLSLISLYENANPQGAADVAQSVYNRMGYSGRTARQEILARNQYQPVRKFGGYSEWAKVVDKETALAHIKKYPGNAASASALEKVAAALVNKSMQRNAANFVVNRPDFRNKGYEETNDEMTDDTTRHNHTFGFNRGSAYKGKRGTSAAIPSFVDADVISSYTPTELKGEGTFIMGKTGRSTGEHFHFGPMELLDSKTLSYVGKTTNRGLGDVRVAVFRVARAMIAKKIDFVFSNSGQWIYANQRLTDRQLQNYILAEQNSHMGRKMGSSWGGIDISTSSGNTRLPLPVGPVKYYNDGFGNRAQILGTKAFVAHGAAGSKATPISQIKKKEAPLKRKPTITPENFRQITERINQSKPGSGETIRIPGVGSYVRGTEGIFPLQKNVDKFYDENGDPLTKEQFNKQMREVLKNNNLISGTETQSTLNPLVSNRRESLMQTPIASLNKEKVILYQPHYIQTTRIG